MYTTFLNNNMIQGTIILLEIKLRKKQIFYFTITDLCTNITQINNF